MRIVGVATISSLVFACAPPAFSAVRYVNAAATGSNNGASWTDAFVDLQSALAAAQAGDEIWVAQGTYAPAPPGDAVTSFVLREGVALYGGFAGAESTLQQRNFELYSTILSGDVGNDDTYNPNGGWPGGFLLNTSNSGHVVVGSNVSAAARIDGFIITHGAYGPSGTPAGDPLLFGSGLYAVNGSPTIANCMFAMNLAAFGPGGAIYLNNSASTISNCVFSQNYVHLGSGGAIYLGGGSAVSIEDCTFQQNIATSYNGSEGQGGAIENRSNQPIAIRGCLFEYNEARPFSAGSYEIPRGGGISSFAFETPSTIRDCIFRSNRAPLGAALFVWNPTTVVNCLFERNTAFVFPGSGGGSVGGEGAFVAQYTDAMLINCTVAYNNGQEAAGVRDISGDPNNPLVAGSVTLKNSIVWGNVASGQDVSPIDAQIKGNTIARYSCVQDLFTPIPGEDPPDPAHYPGCIADSPEFVSATDLHLDAGSPCLDAGQNAAAPPGVNTDLDGLARFYDDPAAPDVGDGTSPLVDMGCYERQPTPCPGDLDGNGLIDLADLAALLAHFGMQGGAMPADGDLDADGDVDLSDLSGLLSRFGGDCN